MRVTYVSLTLLFLYTLTNGQNLEVEGNARITEMGKDNSADSVVVSLSDGTLAIRDVSTLTQYQVLSISNDTIFLSDGGFVKLPEDLVDDADSDASNEIQQLSSNGDTIFISNGNYLILPGLRNIHYLTTVQERLDRGENPLSIVESGVSADSLYGKNYGGGIIFYLDLDDQLDGIDGIVAAHTDQIYAPTIGHPDLCQSSYDSTTIWGCFTEIPTFSAIGYGQINTTRILDSCEIVQSAASVVNNYTDGQYDDWFLPSVDELTQMIVTIGIVGGSNEAGLMDAREYWSSTQEPMTNSNAYCQLASVNVPGLCTINSCYRVRAVRYF